MVKVGVRKDIINYFGVKDEVVTLVGSVQKIESELVFLTDENGIEHILPISRLIDIVGQETIVDVDIPNPLKASDIIKPSTVKPVFDRSIV